MSWVYFKFLFINTIKRKSIWITWLLFLFTCTCFIIILPLAATMNTLQVWANTTMSICQTFMGMVAGLFTAVLAINIFKDTNEEGTELIVISKPISRFKVVLTKFILFGFYCLMVNLTTVLLTAFTAFLPRTEPQFYVGLLVSMFIGNAVTFAVFGSISILLTLKFAKVGIIVVNILISLVFLIYQTLTLFVFSTPLTELDNNSMSASSYIIHDRNLETGEYVEDQVMKFTATPLEGKDHPCPAKNWRDMKDYWENNIKSKDPTPILNVTDLASQLALTYMSYQTGDYAYRQSNRMFGFSRFYNYKLTSPASPEITGGVEDKQSLRWMYIDQTGIDIDEGITFYYPSGFGFEGIPPLTGTRLRGYGDEIPIAHISSKELLSARSIYLEKDQWNKFKSGFDEIYNDVYKPSHYVTSDIEDPSDYVSAFASSTENMDIYYKLIWKHFTQSNTFFDIANVDDLNDRFMQYKNYAYWKSWQEQNDLITYGKKPKGCSTDFDEDEAISKLAVYSILSTASDTFGFGIDYDSPINSGWMMRCKPEVTNGFLEQDTQTLAVNYLADTWTAEYAMLVARATPVDQIATAAESSAWGVLKKTQSIFKTTCDQNESYLFDSLETPHRSNKYRGNSYFVTDTWMPYVYGKIQELMEVDINLPVGQNMLYFFYDTIPTLQYWIFAVIWGSISVGLFTSGIVVYNKYDIK